ncbi:hypothetical protein JCM16163A_31370 [Paenibacillus sp. YK5]
MNGYEMNKSRFTRLFPMARRTDRIMVCSKTEIQVDGNARGKQQHQGGMASGNPPTGVYISR